LISNFENETVASAGRRIDKRSKLPAYAQLANILRASISQGEYPPGGRLPAEAALAKTHGVSTMTARQAVSVLEEEGLVRRAQVFEHRTTAAELRASRLRAIAMLRSSGVDPKDASKLMESGVITLNAPVSGIVTDLSARVGRSYQPGAQPIARLIRPQAREVLLAAGLVLRAARVGRDLRRTGTPWRGFRPDDGVVVRMHDRPGAEESKWVARGHDQPLERCMPASRGRQPEFGDG
jgi:DNA-binding transcriptional regulator YhcF (GntR family)